MYDQSVYPHEPLQIMEAPKSVHVTIQGMGVAFHTRVRLVASRRAYITR